MNIQSKSLRRYVSPLVAIAVLAANTFIIATEPGILHQMAKQAPSKTLIPLPGIDETCACNECPHMKRNTLEKMYLALRDMKPELTMDESLRVAALKPLTRMLAL